MLGTGRVNKVFSPGIITNVYVKKNSNEHESCFYKCAFRHNSACVIQKWSKFKLLAFCSPFVCIVDPTQM